MDSRQIIEALGGVTAVARRLGIKPPSVMGWVTQGIPEGRLIELGADIEKATQGQITRKQLRPTDWQRIWPELAVQQPVGQGV